MYRFVLYATLGLLFAGCSMKTAYSPPSEYKLDMTTEESNATKSTVGETKTVKLEEVMTSHEKTTRTVHSITDIRFIASNDTVIEFPDIPACRIEKGRSYVPSSADEAGSSFRIAIPSDDNSTLGAWVRVDKEGKLLNGEAVKGEQSVKIAPDGEQLFTVERKVLVHRQVDEIPVKRFRQELRYGGIEGDNIVVEYREYTEVEGDPSSAEVLTYNLSASNIIRHKGFRISVLYVDGEKIKFRLLDTP